MNPGPTNLLTKYQQGGSFTLTKNSPDCQTFPISLPKHLTFVSTQQTITMHPEDPDPRLPYVLTAPL